MYGEHDGKKTNFRIRRFVMVIGESSEMWARRRRGVDAVVVEHRQRQLHRRERPAPEKVARCCQRGTARSLVAIALAAHASASSSTPYGPSSSRLEAGLERARSGDAHVRADHTRSAHTHSPPTQCARACVWRYCRTQGTLDIHAIVSRHHPRVCGLERVRTSRRSTLDCVTERISDGVLLFSTHLPATGV